MNGVPELGDNELHDTSVAEVWVQDDVTPQGAVENTTLVILRVAISRRRRD